MLTGRNIKLVLSLFIPLAVFMMGGSAMAVEKAGYQVLEKDGRFEIRRYETQVVAETFVEGDFENAGDEGFRRLYGYISGKNRRKQSFP